VDDRELVQRAQAGDAAAMNTLLEAHYDRVRAVCRRVAGPGPDADDAAQEALIKIVRGIRAFDGRSSFSTWAYRIATNTTLDELRKRRRRPQLHVVRGDTGEAPPEPVDQRAEHDVAAPADRLALDAALADLPEEFRTPVVLRDVGDLDYAEIGEALGVPLGTVKSRIARGRRMLAEALGDTYGHAGDRRHTAGGNHTPTGGRPTDIPPAPTDTEMPPSPAP
jgi:RNA polymerase sigma-70 factor (ECF subfamily)